MVQSRTSRGTRWSWSQTSITCCALVCAALASSAAVAKSGIFCNPALLYTEEQIRRGNAKSKTDTLRLNFGLGVDIDSGFILGAKYYSVTASSDISDSDTEKVDVSGLGLMTGWMAPKNWSIFATWLFGPERTEGSGSGKTVYSDGRGIVIDAGWRSSVGSGVEVGPQLTWSSITYEKSKVGSTSSSLSGTWSDTELYPYLAAWIRF